MTHNRSEAQQAQQDNRDSSGQWQHKTHCDVEETADVLGVQGDPTVDRAMTTLQQRLPEGTPVERRPSQFGGESINIGPQRKYGDYPLNIYGDGTGTYSFHAPHPGRESHNIHDAVDEIETEDPDELAKFAANFYWDKTQPNAAQSAAIEQVDEDLEREYGDDADTLDIARGEAWDRVMSGEDADSAFWNTKDHIEDLVADGKLLSDDAGHR